MLMTGSIEKFKDKSLFKDKKDFNNNMEMWLAEYKETFTKSELIAFKRLARFSIKVKGVANASIRTILKAISDKANGFGISEATFHRMKRKAIKLGILSVETTGREDGSQSSNLWIFNRYQAKKDAQVVSDLDKIDTPSDSQNGDVNNGQTQAHQEPGCIVGDSVQLTPLKTGKLFKTNIHNNNVIESVNELSYEFTSDFVPEDFVQAVKPYINKAKEIEKYWNRFIIAVSKWDDNYSPKELVDIAIDAFRQFVRKRHKIRRSWLGYFYGICEFKLCDYGMELEQKPVVSLTLMQEVAAEW